MRDRISIRLRIIILLNKIVNKLIHKEVRRLQRYKNAEIAINDDGLIYFVNKNR